MQEGQLQIVKIEQIIVENFKLFNGRRVIGPFKDFTTIIGPNGSGKSNIIDALCFALAISMEEMRIVDWKSLITRKPNGQLQNKKCTVEVVFLCKSQKRQNGKEAVPYLRLKRVIDPKTQNNGQFYINEQLKNEQEYEEFLKSQNILTQTKSFLLLQNNATLLSTMRPDAMTAYFEKISGSIKYKDECKTSKEKLDDLENKTKQKTHQLLALKGDKRRMLKIKENNVIFDKLHNEMSQLELQKSLMELLEIDISSFMASEKLNDLQKKEVELKEKKKEFKKNIQALDQELNQFQKEAKSIIEKQKPLNDSQQEKIQLLTQVTASQTLINGHLTTYKHTLQKLQEKSKHQEEEQRKLKKQLDNLQKQQDEVKDKINKPQGLSVLPQEGQDEFQQLNQKMLQQNYSKTSNLNHIKDEQLTSNQQKAVYQSEFSNLQQKKENTVNEIEQLKSNHTQNLQNIKNLELEIKEKTKEIKAQEQKISQKEQRESELRAKCNEFEISVQKLELQLQNQSENLEMDQITQDLKKKIPNCKGALWNNIELTKDGQKYGIAVKQALQGVLNYILVISDDDAKICKELLKSKGAQRDVIILSNIPHVNETILHDQRNALREFNKNLDRDNKCMLIYDLVDCEVSEDLIANCLRYFLQGKICVPDYNMGVQIQKKANHNFKKIITLKENNIIDTSSGQIMCYGDLSRFNNLKIGVDVKQKKDQENIEKEIQKASNKIENFKVEIQKLSDISQKDELVQLQNQFTIKQNEIGKKQQENSDIDLELNKLSKKQSETEQSLVSEKAKLDSEEKKIAKLQQEIDKQQKDIDSLEYSIFKNFIQKYGLQDLSDIRNLDFHQIQKSYEDVNNFQTQIDRIKQQIESISSHKDINKFQRLIEKNEATFLQNEDQIAKLKAELQQINQELTDLKDQLKQKTDKIQLNKDKQDEEINKSKIFKINNMEFERKKSQFKTQIYSNLQKKKQLIQQAQIDDLPIQTNSENHAEFYNNLVVSQTQTNMDQGTKQLLEDTMKIDYTEINELYEKVKNENYSEQRKKETIQEEWNKLDSNLKEKKDQYESLSSKEVQEGWIGQEKINEQEKTIKQLKDELGGILEQRAKAQENYDKFSKLRKDTFMKLFDHVKSRIDHLYKQLSENKKDKSLGQAIMYLENYDFPYLGGTYYSPQPASKTQQYVFDPEGQLSGGEKTMASIALFIAINEAIGSHFVVFDETDEFLDSQNAQHYVQILKKICTRIQCIVISHKVEIFKESMALLGVTLKREVLPEKLVTSTVLSMNLEDTYQPYKAQNKNNDQGVILEG